MLWHDRDTHQMAAASAQDRDTHHGKAKNVRPGGGRQEKDSHQTECLDDAPAQWCGHSGDSILLR